MGGWFGLCTKGGCILLIQADRWMLKTVLGGRWVGGWVKEEKAV